jgi:hypothetical protein
MQKLMKFPAPDVFPARHASALVGSDFCPPFAWAITNIPAPSNIPANNVQLIWLMSDTAPFKLRNGVES